MAARRAVWAATDENVAAAARQSPVTAALLRDELPRTLASELTGAVDELLRDMGLLHEQPKGGNDGAPLELASGHGAKLALLPYHAIRRAADAGEAERMALHDELTLLKGRPYLGRLLDAIDSKDAEDHFIVVASAGVDNLGVIADRWSRVHAEAAFVTACREVAACARRWNAKHGEQGCRCVPIRLSGDELLLPVIMRAPPETTPDLEVLMRPCRELMSAIHTSVCKRLEQLFPFVALDPPATEKHSKRLIKARGPSISIGVSSLVACGPGQQLAVYEGHKVQAEYLLSHSQEHCKELCKVGGRGGCIKFRDDELLRMGGIDAGVAEQRHGVVRSSSSSGAIARERVGSAVLLDKRSSESQLTVARAQVLAARSLKCSGSTVAREHAAAALGSLAADTPENRLAIAQAGAVAPLVELLGGGTPVAKAHAAVALWNLASDTPANKLAIAKAGALAPLVTLLCEGSPSARESAAGALGCLVSDSPQNRIEVARAGAIPGFVKLLRGGTALAKEYAAAALWSLADAPETRLVIAQQGAIMPLVALLRGASVVAKEKAAAALWSLAADLPENRLAIAHAGAIAPLIKMLSGGSAAGRARAAVAIAFVDKTEPLVAARERAAATLGELAADTREHKLAIAQTGTIVPLVALLTSGTAVAREKAAAALGNLTVDAPENKRAIAQAGAIAPLVKMLSDTSSAGKEIAAGALWSLAKNMAENKLAIAQEGAIPPLARMLNGRSALATENAAGALWALASNTPSNKRLIESTPGAVAALEQLQYGGPSQASRYAAGALQSIKQ